MPMKFSGVEKKYNKCPPGRERFSGEVLPADGAKRNLSSPVGNPLPRPAAILSCGNSIPQAR